MISTDELVKRVRRLLNEAEEDARLSLLYEETRSINGHILRLLPQAVALVQKNKAPDCGNVNPRALDVGTAEIVVRDDGKAMIVLPDDFAALVSLQLKGWKRPCRQLLVEGCCESIAHNSGYVRAGVCRPLCVESVADDGSRVALLSPLPGGKAPQLDHFVYEAAFDTAHGLEGCNHLLADAVAYYCAALLYNVFERREQANSLLSLATLLCNGKNVERR